MSVPQKKNTPLCRCLRSTLETVDLDSRLLQAVLNEERSDLGALVALELDDLAHFLVVDERSVAGEFLLERLEELLGVVFLGQALERRQRLPSITLLDTNVDVLGGGPNVGAAVPEEVPFVGKGIVRVEVLYAHAIV